MIKKPDSWLRFGYALAVFWAILCFADLLLTDAAAFNTGLNRQVVHLGYITAVRGIFLALVLSAVLTMTALLRRGLIIAPLIWAAQLGRIAFSGHWHGMMKNLLFVSDGLNLAALILGPVLLAVIVWLSLERLESGGRLGKLVIPGLWLLLAALVSLANLFVWHWSRQFGMAVWPSGYGWIVVVAGIILVAFGADQHPWTSLGLFFLGLLLPTAVYMAVWGWYDGLGLSLLTFLPWGRGDLVWVWAELMALSAVPTLLATGINQYFAWRRGQKLLEII